MKKFTLFIVTLIFSANIQAQELYNNSEQTLRNQWDLNDSIDDKLFEVKQYKPLYILLANYTNNINKSPYSDSPGHEVPEPIPLDDKELKFQLSFKSKVLNNMFGSRQSGDLWLAYTQTSRWQLYNGEISRPFRETNYEPEMMYIIPLEYEIFGFRSVYAGIGFNHQSNGRANPLSRSWNRIIMQFGWENDHTSIVLKPWWRIQEDADVDDNPGIENYLGRTELLVAYGKGRHHLSLLGRHSLRLGENNRGSMQIDYAIRIWENLKINAQVFHGYGESMIDYNHKQTTVGFGLSLTEWR